MKQKKKKLTKAKDEIIHIACVYYKQNVSCSPICDWDCKMGFWNDEETHQRVDIFHVVCNVFFFLSAVIFGDYRALEMRWSVDGLFLFFCFFMSCRQRRWISARAQPQIDRVLSLHAIWLHCVCVCVLVVWLLGRLHLSRIWWYDTEHMPRLVIVFAVRCAHGVRSETVLSDWNIFPSFFSSFSCGSSAHKR